MTEYSSSKVTDTALVNILKEQNDLDINITYTLSEDEALQNLNNKNADLVIIPNNAGRNNYDFSFIAPLTPRALMICTNKDVGEMELQELLETGTVYFEERSRLDSLFFEKLYYHYDIDQHKIASAPFNTLEGNIKSDSLQVYIGLTHLNNNMVSHLIDENWTFFSLDNVDELGKGSSVEGFALMNTFSYPFIIPQNTYRAKPDTSVLTIAIKDILISRPDFKNELAYGIIKSIVEHEDDLAKLDDVYNLLQFELEEQKWAYPFHNSTKRYLSRDKPSIWMQYINNLWPIASIIVILVGAITSFQKIIRKKKRYKIESYYSELNSIRDKADLTDEKEKIVKLIKELHKVKSKAIRIMAQNKFNSSNSFNIFLSLYEAVEKELKEKLEEFK